MLNDLEALEVFASLCTTGSIQKTAQALGIDSPTASRKLTKLETQLGRQLINREKRPFEMTADACAIIGSVKKILEERQQIETYYRRLQSDDSMLIRVMIGNAHINFAPKFILEYAEQFPKLRFNMLSPSDVPSFLEGKADVICLSAQAQLSNCIMLPRGRMIFVPVATPQYLKEHGQSIILTIFCITEYSAIFIRTASRLTRTISSRKKGRAAVFKRSIRFAIRMWR